MELGWDFCVFHDPMQKQHHGAPSTGVRRLTAGSGMREKGIPMSCRESTCIVTCSGQYGSLIDSDMYKWAIEAHTNKVTFEDERYQWQLQSRGDEEASATLDTQFLKSVWFAVLL